MSPNIGTPINPDLYAPYYISMKRSINLIFLFAILSCQTVSRISTTKNNHNKTILLQPIDYDSSQNLLTISTELKDFFHANVIIARSIHIPINYRYQNYVYDETYSADSLIHFLSKLANDSVVEVIGITHQNIYVLKDYEFHDSNKDSKYSSANNIFGLGYVSGNACIISDARLVSADTTLYLSRLRKVILHEVGHNLGLPHCSNDICIMSESNGNIVSLNKAGGDYCENCKRRLH